MDALEWFLTHGGNMEILDGDGVSADRAIRTLKSKIPGFSIIVEKESKKHMAKGEQMLRGIVTHNRGRAKSWTGPVTRRAAKPEASSTKVRHEPG
ncbi:hypothetical protein K443DRAFT_3883 [Laccaria amethystina LaAM-08-1]|uniref:Uncharacterized protein n=1 Tax=Laccaria amethystina LaAM-08-1 TaxID=1095629 RepID=A0A0C9Y5H5_9AGAR|nr:hypothetical protein K443DRAFT_3883 [Laccaria amethystina LaAM-08-1]